MNFKKILLLSQIYIHIMFIVGLYVFPLINTIPTILIAQVIFVGFCGTAFFHRTVSHRNNIHPIYEKLLIIVSWLGQASSALAWAGVHRKHHRYSDTEKDPHSPKYMGKFRAYWQLSNNDTDIVKYVPDLLRKPWYVFQHRHYTKVVLSLHVIGLCFLPLFWYWVLLITPAFLMWFSGSAINVFCHDNNGPKNNSIIGILTAGEGWHKNHHEQPSNPSFRHYLDWGGYIHTMMRLK